MLRAERSSLKMVSKLALVLLVASLFEEEVRCQGKPFYQSRSVLRQIIPEGPAWPSSLEGYSTFGYQQNGRRTISAADSDAGESGRRQTASEGQGNVQSSPNDQQTDRRPAGDDGRRGWQNRIPNAVSDEQVSDELNLDQRPEKTSADGGRRVWQTGRPYAVTEEQIEVESSSARDVNLDRQNAGMGVGLVTSTVERRRENGRTGGEKGTVDSAIISPRSGDGLQGEGEGTTAERKFDLGNPWPRDFARDYPWGINYEYF